MRIPGGRGTMFGRDANVSYSESIDERVQRLPALGEWIFFNVSPVVGSVSCAADRLVLFPCHIQERKYLLYECRISVDVAVASSYLRAAIYVFRSRESTLCRVPFTDVYFDCSSVGQQSIELDSEVELEVGAKYFIGTCASDAGSAFLGSTAANGFLISPVYISHTASSNLPVLIEVDEVTKSSTESVPLVAYISHNASGVM